jgi:predicted Zn-dependent protease
VAVRLAWIASGDRLVLLSGMTRALELPDRRATIEAVLGSARPLAATERAAIRVTRLAVVRARASERLADLVARTGSTWPVPVVAMANAIAEDRLLAAGAAVKIARTTPYR